jgi:hypothetical protein
MIASRQLLKRWDVCMKDFMVPCLLVRYDSI